MQTTNDTTMEATIDRYVVMFNEADDAVRAGSAREVFADDGRLVDPLVEAEGPEHVAAAIGGCATRCPATRSPAPR
jgi:hypothetical protein